MAQGSYFSFSQRVHNLDSRKKKAGEWNAPPFEDKSQRVSIVLQLNSHWLELGHMATPDFKGCWEMQSLF